MKASANKENTPSKARMWIGTLNNPDCAMVESYLEAWYKVAKAVYVTGQLEKGKEGTVHVQYFVQFEQQKRLSALKKHCGKSHFVPVINNNGADDYCNKDETKVDGPWTFGIKPAQLNKKGDLKRRNEQLLELGPEEAVRQGLISITNYCKVKQNIDAFSLATAEPFTAPDTRGVWIWGPPRTGKSHAARTYGTREETYIKPQSKWWDGYTGQPIVILDDHDSSCLGHYLKIWCDKYACTGECKGATIPLLHRKFIVTSNYSPETLYQNSGEEMIKAIRRRCEVIHMDKPFDKDDNNDNE